jgi:hypothetical protein
MSILLNTAAVIGAECLINKQVSAVAINNAINMP